MTRPIDCLQPMTEREQMAALAKRATQSRLPVMSLQPATKDRLTKDDPQEGCAGMGCPMPLDKLDSSCPPGWYECNDILGKCFCHWWDGFSLELWIDGVLCTDAYTNFRGPLVHAHDLIRERDELRAEVERQRETIRELNRHRNSLREQLASYRALADENGCPKERSQYEWLSERVKQYAEAQAEVERLKTQQRQSDIYIGRMASAAVDAGWDQRSELDKFITAEREAREKAEQDLAHVREALEACYIPANPGGGAPARVLATWAANEIAELRAEVERLKTTFKPEEIAAGRALAEQADKVADLKREIKRLKEPRDPSWVPYERTDLSGPELVRDIYQERSSLAVAPNGYTTPWVSSFEWKIIFDWTQSVVTELADAIAAKEKASLSAAAAESRVKELIAENANLRNERAEIVIGKKGQRLNLDAGTWAAFIRSTDRWVWHAFLHGGESIGFKAIAIRLPEVEILEEK